jgi:hypothetical protein
MKWLPWVVLTIGLFLLLFPPGAPGAVYFVSQDSGDDANDGLSWGSAMQTIQAAIDAADSNDTVLVTNGTYATGGRAVHATMTNRVALEKSMTVQSVNGPADTIIQGAGPIGPQAVRCAYVGTNAVLSGFTLANGATHGEGDAELERAGGGAWCEPSGLLTNCVLDGNAAALGGGASGGTLADCTLSHNSATFLGGGAYGSLLIRCTVSNNSASEGGGTESSTLIRCSVVENTATWGGGTYWDTLTDCILSGNAATVYAGGSYFSTLTDCTLTSNSAPSGGGAYGGTLTRCTLTGNAATFEGGGAWQGVLNNCTLRNNTAPDGGGACYGTLTGCTLTGNIAFAEGGGAYGGMLYNCLLAGNAARADDSQEAYGGGATDCMMINCTVADNSASHAGGGVHGGTLKNCIVYSNAAHDRENWTDDGSMEHCCTTPARSGTGNITNNPQFVDAAGGNYRLASGSPGRDCGSNTFVLGATDLDGKPRIVHDTVDMGAYEFQGYWGWAAAITNGLANPTDCATGDGIPNLLKYVTGSSATNPDNLAGLAGIVSNGVRFLVFHRNTEIPDATLCVEGAPTIADDAGWTCIASNFNGSWGGAANVVEDSGNQPVVVTVQDTEMADPNRFLRLRVTRP